MSPPPPPPTWGQADRLHRVLFERNRLYATIALQLNDMLFALRGVNILLRSFLPLGTHLLSSASLMRATLVGSRYSLPSRAKRRRRISEGGGRRRRSRHCARFEGGEAGYMR